MNGAIRRARLKLSKAKASHTKAEWRELFERCGSKCLRCGSKKGLGRDHIDPIFCGGSDGIDNLQVLCRRCNSTVCGEDYRPPHVKAWAEEMAALKTTAKA